jgi:hypothetical protein
MLIEAASIAIWDKNKVVVAMALGVWGTNVVVLTQGTSLPLLCSAGRTES